MADAIPDATDAELAILQALWNVATARAAAKAATIRELTDLLYPGGTASAYATVQKLLERLEQKGLVSRSADGVPHRFAAVVGRAELIGRRLRSVAQKLCGGSMTPLLTHLLSARSLKPRELDELRSLIDRLDRSSSSSSSSSSSPRKRRRAGEGQ